MFFDFVLGDGNFVEVGCFFVFVVVDFGEADSEEAEDGLFAFYFEWTVVGAVHFEYDFLPESLGFLLGGGGFLL